jgi:hypothetical protein
VQDEGMHLLHTCVLNKTPGMGNSTSTSSIVNNTKYDLTLSETPGFGYSVVVKVPKPCSNNAELTSKDLGEASNVAKLKFDVDDLYWTWCVWYGGKSVLGLNTDDLIGNMGIIINSNDQGFSIDPRYVIMNNQK